MSWSSFWDRVGKIADTATMTTPLGTVLDMAKAVAAPSPDGRVSDLGHILFSPAGGGAVVDRAMRQATASAKDPNGFGSQDLLNAPYHAVARGTSTWNLVTADVQHGKANFFDPGVWRRRWNDTTVVSPGQAAASAGFMYQNKLANVDPTDPRAQDYFHHDPTGVITSGAYDLVSNLVLDPLYAAGKGAKAARLANTEFKTNEARDLALKISSGELTAQEAKAAASKGSVGRQAVKGATKLEEYLASTRGQSMAQIMAHPIARDTGDAGALAYWMHRADQAAKTDAEALAAKRDIFAVALGDQKAADQLAARHADLLSEMQTMMAHPDPTRAQELFRWEDNGQGMLDYFNQIVPPETATKAAMIQDQLTRLERLANIQGSTSKFGTTALDKMQGGARNADLLASLEYDGLGNRPIRVVRGTVGKSMPGHINAKEADHGIDELRRVLARSSMSADERLKYLEDFANAPTREQRSLVAHAADTAMLKAEAARFGKTPEEAATLVRLAQGRRSAVRNALRSSLYSAAPDVNYIRHVDGEDGVVHFFDRPFLQSQLEDMVPISDPRAIRSVLKDEARTGWLGDMTRGGQYVTDIVKDAARIATSGWKNLQLFRGAYPLRVQVDSQMRLLASLGALQYMLSATRGTKNVVLRKPSDMLRSESFGTYLDEAGNWSPIDIAPARDAGEYAAIKGSLASHTTRDIMMTQQRNRILGKLRSTGNFGKVAGADPSWGDAYLRATNRQIRNSPTAMRMLVDGSDESVAQFVRSDAAAQKEWSNFAPSWGNDLPSWLEAVRGHVNHTVPHAEVRAVLTERQLTGEDLARHFDDVATRPDVHGESFVPIHFGEAQAFWQRMRDGWYHLASDLPESVMAKHPLYNARFRQHMREVISRQAGEVVTSKDVARARRIADRKARADVGNTMFNIADTSNLSHLAMFVSPFFAAWEDTMTKWARLLYEDPSRVVRLNQAWNAPNDANLVTVDDRGVEQILLPKAFAPIEGAKGVSVRKDSFNIVFQGEPWWLPGFGPMVQVPVNEIIKSAFPTEAKHPVMKYILPYGVNEDGIGNQIIPSWMRKVRSAFGTSSSDYKQTYALLLAQETTKYNLGQRPTAPTREEIAKATRNWHLLRALTAFGAPVTANPTPEFQFYLDQAHEYRNNDQGYRAAYKAWQQAGSQGDAPPQDWQEAFYRDFPDYYLMSISLSHNNTGIVASAQAYNATQAHRKQIAENPGYGWYFVGPDNTGPFDQGVYANQKSQAIGFGNPEHFRSQGDPVQAVKDAQAEVGWMTYRKGMTMLQLELEARGKHSFNQRGAEDLAALKEKFVAALEAENPDWAAARLQRNEGKAHDFLAMAVKNTPMSMANRPDVVALREYLQGRRQMQQWMAQRGVKRLPSASDSRNPNADMRTAWDQFTSTLISNNIGFEYMWQRALEADDLTGDF